MKNSQLILHQFEFSPFCLKVRKALDHKQIPYVRAEVSLLSRAYIKRHTGLTTVPVLQRGDAWIADSTVICRSLDHQVGDRPLRPDAGTSDAVLCDLWEDWADEALPRALLPFKWLTGRNAWRIFGPEFNRYPQTALNRALQRAATHVMRREMKQRLPRGGLSQLEALLAGQLDLLERRLAQAPFLLGQIPFVCDFAVYGMLALMQDLEGWELVTKRPRLRAMLARVDEIPSTATDR